MNESRTRPFAIILLLGAAAGLIFSSVSTYDFAQHLDRQIHGLHCSFIPGLGDADVSGTSGCHVTLMSPYSSVFRTSLWGGIPISLPGMGVFAFIAWRALSWLLAGRDDDRAGVQVLLLSSLVPLGATIVMGTLSLYVLDALCKVCAGIYISSLFVIFGAVGVWRTSGPPKRAYHEYDPGAYQPEEPAASGSPLPALGALALYALLPAVAWAALAPDHSRYIGTCGKLAVMDDPQGVLIPLDPRPGAASTVEVLDPLCPSCKGLEERLVASGQVEALDRKAVLFPLDASCNWMMGGTTMHPGACAVSEAVLCAGAQAKTVVDWAFENQAAIRDAAAVDPDAAKRMVLERFPEFSKCVGSTANQAKLNHSLRWAVRNELPILTPQLYINGERICDADTDLGLDYTLSEMLSGGGK